MSVQIGIKRKFDGGNNPKQRDHSISWMTKMERKQKKIHENADF